nr:hypothetical protein [Paenibacillus xylanexedens]
MYAIRAHLSMFPKWFVTITTIFIIQLVVAMTGYFNFSFLLVNLATLFGAYVAREYKFNKISFVLCLILSIRFVMLAIQSYSLS